MPPGGQPTSPRVETLRQSSPVTAAAWPISEPTTAVHLAGQLGGQGAESRLILHICYATLCFVS